MQTIRFILSFPFRLLALIACMVFMPIVLVTSIFVWLFVDSDIEYYAKATVSVAHTVMFGGTKWYNEKYEIVNLWDNSN